MPHRELILELQTMCMYDSRMQVRLLMQTVEHKQADQRRHSVMHPDVHHWIPEGSSTAKGSSCLQAAEHSKGRAKDRQRRLWDRL